MSASSAASAPAAGPPKRRSSEALSSLILDSTAAEFLERAFHSGRSTMVFGPSGNGKTHVITEFIRRLGGEVLVPYAIYAYGQIIRIYDPLNHERVRDDDTVREDVGQGFKRTVARDDLEDRRWVKIKRPGLIVGGELTAESLELGYDPLTHFYQAPKHLKAQGGFLVVDDFGRQKVSPTELLNRWIMAMERGRDNLLLRTGESIDVPFHITLLLSTNLNPTDLADAAFLRRIPYKAYIPPTSPEQFSKILRKVAAEYKVSYTDSDLEAAVVAIDKVAENGLSGSLARDLVAILVDSGELEGKSPEITPEGVTLAYKQFSGFAQHEAAAALDGKKSARRPWRKRPASHSHVEASSPAALRIRGRSRSAGTRRRGTATCRPSSAPSGSRTRSRRPRAGIPGAMLRQWLRVSS